MNKKRETGKYFKFLVYVIIVILINVAGATLFSRVDLTSGNIYSLSRASKEAVKTLSEPLTINVFFTKDLPAPHNNTRRYLRDLLEEYSVNSNKYFNYRFYDVSVKEGDLDEKAKKNQELAHSYGIYPVQIKNIEQDEVQFKKAYMGIAMIHGDIIDKIPSITSTDGLEYKITSKIEKMNNKISALLNLKNQIIVRLYYSTSIEEIAPKLKIGELPQIPGKIESVVEKLNDKYYSRLEFQKRNSTLDPSLEGEISKYNVMTLKWPTIKDKSGNTTIEKGNASIGITILNNEKYETIELINVMNLPIFGTQYQLVDMNSIEEKISEAIDDVIDINKKIGYLTDHGTAPLKSGQSSKANSIDNFNSLLSNSYSISEVNLKESGIPDGIDCLIIAGPKEKFSDYELFEIDQFLMRGKSIAFFIDPFKQVMPPEQQMQAMYNNREPSYVPLKTGLEKLIANYGVQTSTSYILDEECYEQRVSQMYGGGKQSVYFAPLIKSKSINNKIEFMKNIKGLITLKASSVKPLEDKLQENGLSANVLFSSSDRAWEMSGRISLNPMMMRPPVDPSEFKSFPLTLLVEGEFPSYFKNKEIPEKPVEEKEGEKESGEEASKISPTQISDEKPFLTKGKPGKIFVTGTSELLTNSIIDETGKAPSSTFIMNLIDKLNGREAYASMRSKSQHFNPLGDTSAGTRTFVKTFNIAGLPVIVIILGVLVWMRRESKKRNIQRMFEK